MRNPMLALCLWMSAAWLVPASVAASPQATAPSGSMVVVIPGDANYHVPGCPLVAKAGSKVRVMSKAEAEKDGLTAHDCQAYADRSGKPSAAEANAVAVYVQAGDTHYHKADCRKLGANPQKVTLDEAGRKYWPCPVCKPPIRQKAK